MSKTYSIDEIESMLSNGIYKVTYTSAQDGGTRTTVCTRDFEWLRSDGIAEEMDWVEPKGGDTKNFAIKAWDIDKEIDENGNVKTKGWRSFYANLVTDIEFYAPTKDEEIED